MLPIACLLSIGWRPLPHPSTRHMDRQRFLHAAGALSLGGGVPAALASPSLVVPRTAASVDSWPAIPVWPTWGGGRVVPISPDPAVADPFLLLAHHKHSFTPGDPLRGPFKAVGGALGLPYVGDEGFKLHPHRGIDILTYILDGSDGFRHTDSLGGETTYRGGSAQFMRSGRGALHEEMWETRSDRTTRIELFQLWVNLPASQKMDPPAIRYLGREWGAPYAQRDELDAGGRAVRVRDALDAALLSSATEGGGDVLRSRPQLRVRHATLASGATWTADAPREHTAMVYVSRGSAITSARQVDAGSTAVFARDGDAVRLTNAAPGNAAAGRECEVLLLTGAPLREPVALGGPIVMNTEEEVRQAYRELRDGTFLDA